MSHVALWRQQQKGLEMHLPSSVAKEVATTSKSLRQKHHQPREDQSQSVSRHAPLRRASAYIFMYLAQHGTPELEILVAETSH